MITTWIPRTLAIQEIAYIWCLEKHPSLPATGQDFLRFLHVYQKQLELQNNETLSSVYSRNFPSLAKQQNIRVFDGLVPSALLQRSKTLWCPRARP